MRTGCRFLSGGLPIGLLVLLSCERTPQDSGPFHQPLGGARVLAPTPTPVIDTGLLADQSAYQPARYGAAEPQAAQVAAGEEGETEAIRARVREVIQAAVARNVDAFLEAFVQEQIAAVLPLKSTVIETIEKLEALQRQMTQLGGQAVQPGEGQSALMEALGGKLMDAFAGALTVEMSSADQAVVSIDVARFQESLTALLPEVQDGLQQMAAASGDPTAAAALPPLSAEGIASAVQQLAGYSLSMTRVEEVWRIALPLTLTEAHAEIGREGLALLNEYLDKVMEQLPSLDAADQAAITNLFMQVGMEMLPKLMELMMKVQALQATDGPAEGAESAAQPPEGEEEGTGEDEEAPAGPRGGRSPRAP